MISTVVRFAAMLNPWHPAFDAVVLAMVVAYVLGHVLFSISLRRLAMAIPGPRRMCNPLGIWLLAVPVIGALASFAVLRDVWEAATAATDAHHIAPPRGVARGFAIAYGLSRLLILAPGMILPALLLQSVAATGFLLRLASVARSLRTPDVAVA
jgi:hypothetical protein